jgi:hypothetical protein
MVYAGYCKADVKRVASFIMTSEKQANRLEHTSALLGLAELIAHTAHPFYVGTNKNCF